MLQLHISDLGHRAQAAVLAEDYSPKLQQREPNCCHVWAGEPGAQGEQGERSVTTLMPASFLALSCMSCGLGNYNPPCGGACPVTGQCCCGYCKPPLPQAWMGFGHWPARACGWYVSHLTTSSVCGIASPLPLSVRLIVAGLCSGLIPTGGSQSEAPDPVFTIVYSG